MFDLEEHPHSFELERSKVVFAIWIIFGRKMLRSLQSSNCSFLKDATMLNDAAGQQQATAEEGGSEMVLKRANAFGRRLSGPLIVVMMESLDGFKLGQVQSSAIRRRCASVSPSM